VKTLRLIVLFKIQPIEFCRGDPCEDAALMVSENYNGNGQCPHIPGSDVVSSIRIPSGISLEVFGNTNFEGTRRVFGVPLEEEPSTSLESILNVSMGDYGMDNRISSFIIRRIPADERVTLCTTFNCGNRGGSGDFSVGSYNTMPRSIGEDLLSRIRLPPGWKIQVFEARRFRGESLILTNNIERNHNHRTSSQPLVIEFQGEYAEWNGRVRSMIISTMG
jgi:hypothetical protein